MKKSFLVLFATLMSLCFTGCGTIDTAEETEIPEIEVTQEVETPTPEITEAPEPETPQFCGSWRTTAPAGDGTEFVLEVYLNGDGSARYRAGYPYSEYMMDAKGTWGEEGDTVTLDLYDTMEGFAFVGTYKWEMDGNGLSLTHTSGDAFLYGTEGTTIVFNRK